MGRVASGWWLVAGGWSGERPDQSVDQSAHLLDQVQICRKIPLRKVAESDRTQSDCETIGILEDEDDDEHEDDSSNSEFCLERFGSQKIRYRKRVILTDCEPFASV